VAESEEAMLDAYIIEEIKRREEERQRRESERPTVQIPPPEPDRLPQQSEEDKPQRGVIIIDYSV
jgi:hypothetical protein